MERDFLGISGKESVKEETRESRQDSVYLRGTAMQWPFANKMSALQQFMSFKAAKEEKPKKVAFDHFPSSGFQPVTSADAFEASQEASHSQAPQKCFNLDRQAAHQFTMHAYQPESTDSFRGSAHHVNEPRSFPGMSHTSFPVAMSSPFFKFHYTSNSPNSPNLPVATTIKPQPSVGGFAATNTSVVGSAGAFAPRNASKPPATTAQLTIFYAGSVNVYDEVPLDKAQAIMFMASKGCGATPHVATARPEAPVPALPKVSGIDSLNMKNTQTQSRIQTPIHVASSCSAHSSQISGTSHAGAHSGSSSSNTGEMAGAKNVGQLPIPIQHEPSPKATIAPAPGSAATGPILPRAVPQARKASLARFLEKRKERVTNAMPYPCAKKSLEDSIGFEGATISSRCSSADISLSSNREESWCLRQHKSSINASGESPSTKLGM